MLSLLGGALYNASGSTAVITNSTLVCDNLGRPPAIAEGKPLKGLV